MKAWVSFRRVRQAEKSQAMIGALLMLDAALGIYHGHENVPQISVCVVHD